MNLPQAQLRPGPSTAGVKTMDPFTTNNYDTVYAIRYTDANAAIVAGMQKDPDSYPSTWSASVPGSAFEAALQGNGVFGPWQLATGGSGTTVLMTVPVPSCTVVANGVSIPVTGVEATIEVHLNLLPSDTTPSAMRLMVRSTAGRSQPAVVVTQVVVTGEVPAAYKDSIQTPIQQLLTVWLNGHLDQFQHVFAIVNLGIEVAANDPNFAWVAPTATQYAVNAGDSIAADDSLLGILCMTMGNSLSGTDQNLSSGAIPAGARACYSISLAAFLSQIVLPSLYRIFPAAPAGCFQLTQNNTWIQNIVDGKPVDVKLDKIKIAATSYQPVMQQFAVYLSGDRLRVDMHIETEISPGITGIVDSSYYYWLQLATVDGQVYLKYVEDVPSRKEISKTQVAPGVKVAVALTNVLVAVASAVTGGASQAGETMIKRVVVAIVSSILTEGIVAPLLNTPNWVSDSVNTKLPPFTSFASQVATPVQWNAGGTFVPTAINFNGALQLQGNPFPPAG